jgi:hypothetical protein
MVNTTEQFPDFDELDDKPSKSKKGNKKGKKGVVKPAATATLEDDEVDQSVPWKGKKSEFFVLKQ